MSDTSNDGPLTGVRILDLTSVLLGPFATQIMGDMGADVIKIEAPEGDIVRHITPFQNPGMGAVFLNANRNKRGVCLDLKQQSARDALLKLVEDADVLVSSIRPKSMRKMGLGDVELHACNPRLIYCLAHGFGEAGPYGGRPAYDDIIQAASGVAALHAMASGDEPRYVASVMADKTVGLTVLAAISMALYRRGITGVGQTVEVPMFETMAAFVMTEHLQGATFEPRQGATGYHRALAPHRRPYRTADGHVAMLPYTGAHWTRFFQHNGREDLIDLPMIKDSVERSKNVGKLYEILSKITPTRTTAEWLAQMNEIDVPAMPINTPDMVLEDAHLKEIDFFPLFDHPTEGRMRMVGQPISYSESPPNMMRRPAPRLGQHSREVLSEAGLSAAEIDAMLQSGAAVEPTT